MAQTKTRSAIVKILSICRFLLPALHLCACLVIWFLKIESGWEQLIKIDFPFSIALGGLVFASDRPLLWFGVLGSLWWFFLPWLFWFVLREYSLLEAQKADKTEP